MYSVLTLLYKLYVFMCLFQILYQLVFSCHYAKQKKNLLSFDLYIINLKT